MSLKNLESSTEVAALTAQIGGIIWQPGNLPVLHINDPRSYLPAHQEIADVVNRRITKGIKIKALDDSLITIDETCDSRQLQAIAELVRRKSHRELTVIPYDQIVLDLISAARIVM